MSHPVRYPRYVFNGPGRVKISMGDETDTPRCRQAVVPLYGIEPKQCAKKGTVLENGNLWFCHIHAGLK